ncbi:MAG: hypothetical protein KBB24_05360 [Bacteroidales bacterium]|jgi:hypothetical protein|nr:hypothetical protein [Bacteroidales bacterium]MDX9926828.1 hypothetical protein [Bacteroidales bacterium]HNX84589.1 hypothetical protein [Bacteroidales bacterium]HPS98639.1 hypothetical protein [Bacteroidales bacterium]HQL46387.1 hypothetical protein [Bacteroidales bacterium]
MKILQHMVMCLVLLGTCDLAAQEVMQKASRTDERSFGKGISGVSVYGEKATVTVRGTAVSELKVLLRPVSRNRNKELAVADLKYIHYSAEKEGDILVIRNSFRGQPEQITSNLSMEIEIIMPSSLPVSITNLYGPVEAGNLASMTANVSFGSLRLTDIGSATTVTARYSDMELTSIRGKADIKAEKSDILMTALGAATVINCSYGTANLELAGSGPLIVKGYRTTVNISLDEPGKFQYALKAPQGRIIMSDGKQYRNQPVEVIPQVPAGLIDVTTSYCDITIAKK